MKTHTVCRLNSRQSLRERMTRSGPMDLELELYPVPSPSGTSHRIYTSSETAQVRLGPFSLLRES